MNQIDNPPDHFSDSSRRHLPKLLAHGIHARQVGISYLLNKLYCDGSIIYCQRFYFQITRKKLNEIEKSREGNFSVPFVNQPLPFVFVADSITCIRQRPNSSMIMRS